MKKKYIQPNVSVSFVVVESLLQNTSGGLNKDQNDDGGGAAKKHDFSSWDYDFDEEEDTESNFKSKSLWD